MLNDYELFCQLCEKRGLLVPAEVSEAIKVGSSTGELRLSCLSIMVPICEIIAQTLASSSTIKTVDLSDCMLLSRGLCSILSALCEGSSVTSLNLKGNNINGSTVAQLGQVFVHNNTLKRLHLEWNSLGSHVDYFSKFCEGLCKNHNIDELDLRYNQISPSCAEALSKVLRSNKSLRTLDLAWNTIGLQGGELILNGMRENRNIIKLNLRGNCVPNEIVEAIEERAYDNQRQRAISDTNISKGIEVAKTLAIKENIQPVSLSDSDSNVQLRSKQLQIQRKKKKMSKRKKRRKFEMSDAMEHPQNVNSESDDSPLSLKIVEEDIIRVMEPNVKPPPLEVLVNDENAKMAEVNGKINELNQMLQDRTTAINSLTAEIAEKVVEIDATRSQVNELQAEIGRLREEREKFEAERAKDIAELKTAQKEANENWQGSYKELEESYNRTLTSKKESDAKARRYERDIHKSSLEIIALKEKLLSATQTYEDLISKDKTEMHRLRREQKERESRHRIELNVLKNTLKETTQALEECQAQLQKSRAELREASENQLSLKTRLSEMEHVSLRYARSEEALQRLKEEKEGLEEKLTDAQRTIGTLQRQVATLQSELIEPQRRYDLLKDELDQERQKSARLKQELQEERSRLKEQNVQMQNMTLQITALNTQFNEIQINHAEALRERDKERKQLKEIIAHKERDLNELKAEEVQRAGQLYTAFSKYLGSIGLNPAL